MFASDVELVVTEEFASYLPGKFDRCSHELESVIVSEGRARDPIVCWVKDGKRVVVDGHRRLQICKKHNLEFDLVEMEFSNNRAAKHWMDSNQFVRRNLTGHERAILIGRMDKYLEDEKAAGRFDGRPTAEVAKQLGVKLREVQRGKKHADAINKVAEPLRSKIVQGDMPASVATIQALAEMPEREQLNAASQVEQGEFASLGEAVSGCTDDSSPVPTTTRKAEGSAKATRKPRAAAEQETDSVATLPLDSEPKASHDVLQDAIRALGMLGKALDALNEQSPNGARMSSCHNHIAGIRALLKTWGKNEAA